VKFSKIKFDDNPKQFYISYMGMHYHTHSDVAKKLNTFKNVFFGYYKEQNRRLLKLKIKSLNKRLTLKVKKIISQITSNN
jgi:mevalonate kinase